MSRFPIFTLIVGALVLAVVSLPGLSSNIGACSEQALTANAQGASDQAGSHELVAHLVAQVQQMNVSAALAPVMDCAADAAATMAARLDERTADAVQNGVVTQVMSHKSFVGQFAAMFQEPAEPRERPTLVVLVSDVE